ncbi:hypothetical protein Arth_1360 [Arthrobacter sp. FB24]|uniref:hypothetical protein n=1 Tax=Arthrobacter sp. (strain FB24) TaxID=290399 RepID=UPI0000527044|nr:hypothetical protein [Arthrobacter sp. FB24]ABK02754.1 hypothetical protein Arth_1360 [Arthrobacter sp. FB24]
MAGLTKQQKQLLLANGLLAGLAELGVEELDSSNMAFEFPFMHAWRRWAHSQNSAVVPKIEYGSTSQPRDILHRVTSSTSPFKDFERNGVTSAPHGLTPREFLEIHCDQLPADAWVELASLFLAAQAEYARKPSQ